MDVTTTPKRRFLATTDRTPHTLFIKYFRSSPSSSRANLLDGASSALPTLSKTPWLNYLAPPTILHRQPAWCRVPIQPYSSSRFTSSIMKRLGLYFQRNLREAHNSKQASNQRVDVDDVPECQPELGDQKRLKPVSYQPADGIHRMDGSPMSTAEIINMMMQARVDVVNGMVYSPTTTPFADLVQSRLGRYVRALRKKRRLGFDFLPDNDFRQGGNRPKTYYEIFLIIAKMAELDMQEVDVKTASIAFSQAALEGIGRETRQYLAAWGVPELSTISDKTEPESLLSLMKLPELPAEPSPTKLSSVPSTPMGGPSPSHASTNNPEIFSIDMKRNPDIFGRQAPESPPNCNPSVGRLAQIAEGYCDGKANVIIAEESDKLVVRFKLPTKYAHLFPGSQCEDASRFSVSPSAISTSPRIRTFSAPLPKVVDEPASPLNHSQLTTELQSPMTFSGDHTLPIPDFAPSPVMTGLSSGSQTFLPQISLPVEDSLEAENVDESSIISLPSCVAVVRDTTIPGLEHIDFEAMAQSSPMPPPGTAEKKKQPSTQHTESSAEATYTDSTLTELSQTPSISNFRIIGNASPTNVGYREDCAPATTINPSMTFSQPFQPTSATRPTSSKDEESPTKPDGTCSLGTFFTPVNAGSRENIGDVRSPTISKQEQSGNTQPVSASPAPEHDAMTQEFMADRDFLRGFLARATPKRLSTTEKGSPIQTPGRRQPLQVKSPNADSPRKAKRKLETETDENSDPTKRVEADNKKARRDGKEPSRKLKATSASKGGSQPQNNIVTKKTTNMVKTPAKPDDSRATRRSSRLKNQGKESAPKSSIPTPIKIGRNGPVQGNSAGLNASVRNAQQDLTYQTRMNTRKNKENAEYPAEFLAKYREQAQEEETSSCNLSSGGRKCVNWGEPLVMFQEAGTQRITRSKAKRTKA